MAWLIRDQRTLLDKTACSGGKYPPTCSNGTSFLDLDPDGFSDCPGETDNNNSTPLIINSIIHILLLLFIALLA